MEHRVELAGEGVDLEPRGLAEEALLTVEGQPRQPVGVVRRAGQVASTVTPGQPLTTSLPGVATRPVCSSS